VTLFIFGGVSSLKGEPNAPGDEFRIAIIGPITSFALAALFAVAALLLSGTGIEGAALYLALINAILGTFNLLPGFPLDGGRVLRSALWARSHSLQTATRLASQTGTATALILMILGVVLALAGVYITGIWLIVIGWFLRSQAEAGYSQLITQGVLDRTNVLAVLEPDYHAVHPSTSLESLVNGYLLHYSKRYFPVSTDWGLEGLITVTDLQRVPRGEWQNRTVADAMTPSGRLHTLDPQDSLGRAAELIAAHDINQLPVIDEGHLLGFVTRAGIMHILEYRKEEVATATQEGTAKTPRTSQSQTGGGASAADKPRGEVEAPDHMGPNGLRSRAGASPLQRK
jgi:CBS domain-containing protein